MDPLLIYLLPLSSTVRSFGTEDRETQFPIAAQNQVYDYILFRGSDIKDIRVCNPTPVPNDPAIMQMHLPPQPSGGMPQVGGQPPFQPPHFPPMGGMMPGQQNPGPFGGPFGGMGAPVGQGGMPGAPNAGLMGNNGQPPLPPPGGMNIGVGGGGILGGLIGSGAAPGGPQPPMMMQQPPPQQQQQQQGGKTPITGRNSDGSNAGNHCRDVQDDTELTELEKAQQEGWRLTLRFSCLDFAFVVQCASRGRRELAARGPKKPPFVRKDAKMPISGC